jgi:hypothetical protein
MQPKIKLSLNPQESAALSTLTAEERDAVIDEMLKQVREDLEWVLALESARVRHPPESTMMARPWSVDGVRGDRRRQ